jgi:hypothetical protein
MSNLRIIPIKPAQEPTSEDLLIDEVMRQERIGSINSGIKGAMLLTTVGLMMYVILFWLVLGVPRFVSSFMAL